MRRLAVPVLSLLVGCSVTPTTRTVDPLQFQKILEGWWDEGNQRDMPTFCNPDRNLHRHLFSNDGKTVTWEFERAKTRLDGSETKSYRYGIRSATSVSIVLELEGETRKDEQGQLLVWELVVVDQAGIFRWRATTFPPGVYNAVWGRRCR